MQAERACTRVRTQAGLTAKPAASGLQHSDADTQREGGGQASQGAAPLGAGQQNPAVGFPRTTSLAQLSSRYTLPKETAPVRGLATRPKTHILWLTVSRPLSATRGQGPRDPAPSLWGAVTEPPGKGPGRACWQPAPHTHLSLFQMEAGLGQGRQTPAEGNLKTQVENYVLSDRKPPICHRGCRQPRLGPQTC